MRHEQYDVTVIGGGPAGLAAACSAIQEGVSVLLIEREESLGGILKQCIHDGFGLARYGERLTGPEYAARDISLFRQLNGSAMTGSFVTDFTRTDDGVKLTVSGRDGMCVIDTRALILASGCRERTAKQIFVHGDRPAGVFTAGTVQHFINIDGVMPAGRCVILGSGDIGLIMARRITLEGGEVIGVYEAKDTPGGLARNIAQCLDDFDIPLHLSSTVTRVFGKDRVEAVETAKVDENLRVIEGTEEIIPCDTLIVSVGLIPENEAAVKMDIPLSPSTKGPLCDQHAETMTDGIFAAGNCLMVNDLADYVSEMGELAGKSAAAYVRHHEKRDLIPVHTDAHFTSCVPQYIDRNDLSGKAVFYLRTGREYRDLRITATSGGSAVGETRVRIARPAETQRVAVDLSLLSGNDLMITAEDEHA